MGEFSSKIKQNFKKYFETWQHEKNSTHMTGFEDGGRGTRECSGLQKLEKNTNWILP